MSKSLINKTFIFISSWQGIFSAFSKTEVYGLTLVRSY